MQWLIFLFLVTACGQHIEPSGKDIRDRDGDQIVDGDEVGMNKFIANISPIETVQMIVKLKGHSGPGVNYENGIDVIRYSRDLMVKNTVSIPKDDYFAEWSSLVQKEGALPEAGEEHRYILKLSFNRLKNPPTRLNIISSDKLIMAFDWSPEMEIPLSKDQYKNLQSNSFKFTLSRIEKINPAYQVSQQESVKDNTYRVLMNNGESTQIFYVAKGLPFEDFLREINIQEATDINQVNLLTTSYEHSISQWWVRTLNGKDKVLLKDDLKNITQYRLQGFMKKNHKLGRVNGHTTGQLKIEKQPAAAVLLKIRGDHQMRTFSKRYEVKNVGSPAREGYRVKKEIIDIAPNAAESLTTEEILGHLMINGLPLDQKKDVAIKIQIGTDKQGSYMELILETERTDFILNVPSLNPATFVATGVVRQKIDEGRWENLPGTATNPEGYLNLAIEAYVEKL